MQWKSVVMGISLVWSLSAVAEKPSAFTNQSRPKPARVTILAVSSSSRQNFAGNREVYLADLQLKNGNHEFVRLYDQYPGYGLPIRDTLLRNQMQLAMKVTREPDCDVPGSQIALATSKEVVFDASVRDTLAGHRNDLVPCYKALHNTIRLVKSK